MVNKPKKIDTSYGADSITVLEGLDPVRRRPGMYIGSTAAAGLHHLIWEVINNCIDEAMAGYGKEIIIRIMPDNIVEVTDYGRGIPVEIHPQTKKSTLETVLTVLHAGGKFGGNGYKISGGLHGVGVSVVNALSVWTKAEVHRDGKVYAMEFERGIPKTKEPKVTGKSTATGTIISFQADPQIFPEIKYSWEKILAYVRHQAFLVKGITIKVYDQREAGKERAYGFLFDGGLTSFIKFLNRGKEVKNELPFYVEKEDEKTESVVEIAMQYTDSYKEHVFSFANNIFTPEGGMHEVGFRTALTRVMNSYARKSGLLKEKDENLTAEDLQEGLTAVISVKLRNPQFEGQTKAKLGNGEMRGIVSSITAEALSDYLESHPNNAKAIIGKCMLTNKARIAARAAKDAVIRKGALEGMTLPGKLADCSSRNPAETEVYIVEGDSAGGCFDGNTKIALADGRNLNFFELIAEETAGIKNYCYTIKSDGEIGIEKIKNVRKTQSGAEVIKIILDNDEELVCTPDHLFMLRDGSYKKAADLRSDDSLMPLRKQYSRIGKRITIKGYEMVFDPGCSRWIFTHMLADGHNLENKIYKEEIGAHRHHINFDKLNNNPDNLVRMTKESHLALHRKFYEKNLKNPIVLQKLRELRDTKEFREKMSKRMKMPKTRKLLSENAKKQWENEEYKKFMMTKFFEFYNSNAEYRKANNALLNAEQKKYWSKKENREQQSEKVKEYFISNPEKIKELSVVAKKQWSDGDLLQWRSEETKKQWTADFREKRKTSYNKTYLNKALKLMRAIYDQYKKIDVARYDEERKKLHDKSIIKFSTICERFFNGDRNRLNEAVANFNHKIKSIEKIKNRMDVFDLEVPETHNFALSSGIFVHNSAKQGRNRKFQAILPLRGKLVNVEKTTLDKVVKSDTLKPIIIALGAGIGDSFNIEKLRYHRIIIMADADVDGSHIRTLLLTFFYRYYEPLITSGFIYIAQPPLYRIQKGKDVQYVYTEEEKNIAVDKIKIAVGKNKELKKTAAKEAAEAEAEKEEIVMETDDNEEEEEKMTEEKSLGINIQRYKGLGEMNPEQLWETTMDPDKRLMLQVTIEDAAAADKMFDVLMGSDVEPRRRFIQTHAKSVKNLDV